jgi:hypothetical protein
MLEKEVIDFEKSIIVGIVVEKDTERYYYTNVNLAVKHCLLDKI